MAQLPTDSKRNSKHRRRGPPIVWPVVLAVATGLLAGMGAYTFRYAEGLSYLSRDPKACVNCHIMQSQYDGWQKASHHTVAVCVDCHLPHAFIAKYYAKAENGFRHGKKFTTQTFDEPIVVQAEGLRILQENCIGCHEPMVDQMVDQMHGHANDGLDDTMSCVHCHATVGHGERAGLGGPMDPLESSEPTPL